MYAGKNNHVSICFCSLLRQSKTIANKICNILYIRLLVIMRQHNGIFFFFQSFNFMKQIKRRININIQKTFYLNFCFRICNVHINHNICINKYIFI